MASPRVSQSSGHSCWKQWWRRSSNSKKILLLLVWQALFTFSWVVLLGLSTPDIVLFTSTILSHFLAPLIGWLADVRFGRFEIIRFGSITSFLASILYYLAMITGGSVSTVLSSLAIAIVSFGYMCYSAAMLPF